MHSDRGSNSINLQVDVNKDEMEALDMVVDRVVHYFDQEKEWSNEEEI